MEDEQFAGNSFVASFIMVMCGHQPGLRARPTFSLVWSSKIRLHFLYYKNPPIS